MPQHEGFDLAVYNAYHGNNSEELAFFYGVPLSAIRAAIQRQAAREGRAVTAQKNGARVFSNGRQPR